MSRYHDKKYPVVFSLQMTHEQHDALMQRAARLGISAAEVIRRMISLK